LTKTDMAVCLTTIENAIGRRLRDWEVVHTFSETGELDIAGHKVRRIDASRIEEDERVGVVFFKMSLSTGWDCPRAEVMMSFRRAQDHTYIAQLLGRMVRTPLARRIEADASLNDVHLFLPHYDQEAVNIVIEDLKDVENVPPSETGTARELVILNRQEGLEDVFEAMKELVTYRVNAVRKQSALRRLMGLGRGLTQDQTKEIWDIGSKSEKHYWYRS
jgi:type III restriction enzyme